MSQAKLDQYIAATRRYACSGRYPAAFEHVCLALDILLDHLLSDKQPEQQPTPQAEWRQEVAEQFPAPQRRINELIAEVGRLRKAIAGNLGGNDLCSDDTIEELEKACIDAGQMAWNLGIRVIQSDKLHEEEVERLTQERDVVRREIETIREACGWEQSGELTSVLVERMHADLKDLRQDLEEVNEFARSLGHGQGAIDNGLVDCLKESFAKYEQLRGMVKALQNTPTNRRVDYRFALKSLELFQL